MTTTFAKKQELRQLNLGDIVRCTNGSEYEFVRLKQSKFLGKNRGMTYDIPVEMFVEVVSTAEKVQFDPNVLQEGELFYILDNKQNATIYRFKYMINADKVKGVNPVTGTAINVPARMVEGSVNDLIRKGRDK